MTVSPETGRYQCWSCGEKGDIFTWVMKTQNVDFPEALRTLAIMAGVTLSKENRGVDSSVRENHRAAMAEAQAFFREQLGKSEGAKAYCERRKLPPDILETWGIGFSPDSYEVLTTHLKKKGFSLTECKTLFLVDGEPDRGYHDKFRGRLMFPIWNEKGELVAFGGRLLGPGEPKYINSSDTPLYSKSKVLYGMNVARPHLQKTRRAVLVEGYLDVIACHRAGVTTALASLGTSLSEQHAKLLKRWVDEVVILYDSDSAGQKAADRASNILAAEGLRVRVALMPDGEDPDTLLITRGAEAVQASVEQGLTPLEYRLQALDRRLPEKGDEYWPEVVSILADAPTALELEKQTFRLAAQYPGIRDVVRAEKALLRDVHRFRSTRRATGGQAYQDDSYAPSAPKREPIRKRLSSAEITVFRAFLDEACRESAWRFASHPPIFLSDLAVSISEALRTAFGEQAPAGSPSQWIHRLEAEDVQGALEEMVNGLLEEAMTEQVLADAVGRLKAELDQREYNNRSKPEMTTAERQEQLNRLRMMKPDARKKPPTDGLF